MLGPSCGDPLHGNSPARKCTVDARHLDWAIAQAPIRVGEVGCEWLRAGGAASAGLSFGNLICQITWRLGAARRAGGAACSKVGARLQHGACTEGLPREGRGDATAGQRRLLRR